MKVTKTKATRKRSSSNRGCMSDFIHSHPQKKEQRSAPPQHQQQQPKHHPATMATSATTVAPTTASAVVAARHLQEHQKHPQQQPQHHHHPQQHLRQHQQHPKQMQDPQKQQQHKQQHQQPVQRQQRTPMQHQQPLEQQHQPVQQHVKKGPQKFCSLGSLSSFLELKRKKLQMENPHKDLENVGVANGHQVALMNTNEVQPTTNENENNDSREEVITEECQPICTAAPKNKKHRGPTKLANVHARTIDERPVIVLNLYGQPIGPIEKIVKELSRFLGTLARNPEFAPLNYFEWTSLPTHGNIWNYVLEKYMVPIEGKKWVMQTTNELWRMYKSRMKSVHYYAYDTDALRWENRPKTMPESTFRQLLNYWDSEEIQKEKDPNKEEPSKAKVYRDSRARNPKKSYKTNFGVAKHNMEQMDAIESQEHGEDPYHEVIKKPEHSGRVRLYGKGVTKSVLKKGGKSSSYIFPPKFMQSLQMQVVEQVLEANPQVKKLLEANPKVKLVVSDQSSGAAIGKSQGSNSNGQSSIGTHSPNQQVHVELNDGMEMEEYVYPTE